MIEVLGFFLGVGVFPCLLLGIIMLISFLTCDYIEKFVVKAFCSFKNRRRHRYRGKNDLQTPPPSYYEASAPFQQKQPFPMASSSRYDDVPVKMNFSVTCPNIVKEPSAVLPPPSSSLPPPVKPEKEPMIRINMVCPPIVPTIDPIQTVTEQSRMTHRKTQRLSPQQDDPPPSYHSLKFVPPSCSSSGKTITKVKND